jgi:regulator of PEP synthase PpsR (kinase-PPPase family)
VQARRLCAEHGWTVLDVTRRSIEETAAAIIQLLQDHRQRRGAAPAVAPEI